MDTYIEQSVAGRPGGWKRILYGLCWCTSVLFIVLALFFATGVFSDNPHVLEVHWTNIGFLAICLMVAVVIFRSKDHLRMEYDYILRGDELEINGIMNGRRRRTLAVIPLNRISFVGPASKMQIPDSINRAGIKKHEWYTNVQAEIYFVLYIESNIRHIVFLELNDEMLLGLRKSKALPQNAWQM